MHGLLKGWRSKSMRVLRLSLLHKVLKTFTGGLSTKVLKPSSLAGHPRNLSVCSCALPQLPEASDRSPRTETLLPEPSKPERTIGELTFTQPQNLNLQTLTRKSQFRRTFASQSSEPLRVEVTLEICHTAWAQMQQSFGSRMMPFWTLLQRLV